jgi:propanol-preferring alcohol dehydrogenase
MGEMMKAAYMTAPGRALEIGDVEMPRPAPGQVLVELEACGLCHSDIHFWKGDHPLPRPLPAILGHEGIGRVVETGPGVRRLKPGDRVGVGYVYGTCGICKECLTGHETHCGEVQSTGVHVNGCFAEYTCVREDWATAIPEGLDPVSAAPLLCAGVAAYSAVRKAELEPGELAAVFGAGGLGTYAIQIAKLHGAHVAVVDVDDRKLAHAKEVGADLVLRADEDPVSAIRDLGGADACFNFAPVTLTWPQMLAASRACGRIVLVALPKDGLAFDAGEIIEPGLKIMGSADGTRQELRQLMRLAADGEVRGVVTEMPFLEINDAFEQLASGRVIGRLALNMRAA